MSTEDGRTQGQRLALPPLPYLGLTQYEARDSLLYAGREFHIDACAETLAQMETRVLLLHGRTGCGKSSFLRAGLIPELEAHGFGYTFLRDRRNKDDIDARPAIIRCGKDPLMNLARAIFEFSTLPVVLETASGEKSYELQEARLGCASQSDFVNKCADPAELVRALSSISKSLAAHNLVIVLDQMEEVLTLNEPDSEKRGRFFTFLKLFNMNSARVKLILAMRKDHSGEFIGLSQLDNTVKTEFKVFLLPDMTRAEVLRAILLPTSEKVLEGGGTTPYKQYEFRFASGIAEDIVEDLFRLLPRGSILPVVQLLCKDLYARVRRRTKPWVIDGSLYDRSSVENAVKQHITRSLQQALRDVGVDERKLQREEGKWRKVLYRLVRYEGDGRVHSDVLSQSALQERAKTAGVAYNTDDVVVRLIRPNVRLLRQVRVLGADSDEVMFSLGHDVIGLALYAMEIEDEAYARERQQRSQRSLVAAGVATIAFLLLGGMVVKSTLEQNRHRQERIEARLKNAEAEYRIDPHAALADVEMALAQARQIGSDSPLVRRAESLASHLKDAMPDFRIDLSEPQGSGRSLHRVLGEPPGIITVHEGGRVLVRRVARDGKLQLQWANNIDLPPLAPNSSVSVSEPFTDRILLLVRIGSDDRDVGHRLWILRTDEKKGPYDGQMLRDMFDPLFASKHGGSVPDYEPTSVRWISLAGDVVALTTEDDKGKRFVQTLAVNKDRDMPSYFAAGVRSELHDALWEPLDDDLPASVGTVISGSFAVSTRYAPGRLRTVLEEPLKPTSFEAYSLRSRSDNGTAFWDVNVDELPVVRECSDQPFCSFGIGPTENDKLTIGFLNSRVAATGEYQNIMDVPQKTSYVLFDNDTGRSRLVSAETLRNAQESCNMGLFGNAPDVRPPSPPRVDGTLQDLLFVFSDAATARVVRLQNENVVCADFLVPRKKLGASALTGMPVVEWRFSTERNQLLALVEEELFIWGLPTIE